MWIDIQDIRARTDCREVVERDLQQPKYRRAKYSVHRCPFHHETKGYSLVVYADGWRCFGKCGTGGDAIAWVQRYHGLSFADACRQLGGGDLPAAKATVSRASFTVMPETSSEPPAADWQARAEGVAQEAAAALWSEAGARARAYLMEQRGLDEATIREAGLGYVAGDWRAWRDLHGLSVPCGVTLPWRADGTLWGIKVRRAAGEQRYHQVAGGNIKGCLYLADAIRPGVPVLLTEGEFDALTVRQCGGEFLCPASIGSTANRRISARWYPRLIAAPRILARMDADDAGDGAGAALAALSGAVRRVQVPRGKDVNEFRLLAGEDAVRGWLAALVEGG